MGDRRGYRDRPKSIITRNLSYPLRRRLIALIGLVLFASLVGGSVLVGWHGQLRADGIAGRTGCGARTIANRIDELSGADDQASACDIVATFNGNRHVRAALVDAPGSTARRFQLFVPGQMAPEWFRDLIGGRSACSPPCSLKSPTEATPLSCGPTRSMGSARYGLVARHRAGARRVRRVERGPDMHRRGTGPASHWKPWRMHSTRSVRASTMGGCRNMVRPN